MHASHLVHRYMGCTGKKHMWVVQLLLKHGNTLAKLLFDYGAYVNQTVDLNDSLGKKVHSANLEKQSCMIRFQEMVLFSSCLQRLREQAQRAACLSLVSSRFASFIIKITTNLIGFLNCKTAC